MIGLPILKKHTNKSQTAKILRLFKRHTVMSNYELERICHRFGARLYELRQEGHLIVPQHVKGNKWNYHYLGHVDDGVEAG
jgi:hypothetical protein